MRTTLAVLLTCLPASAAQMDMRNPEWWPSLAAAVTTTSAPPAGIVLRESFSYAAATGPGKSNTFSTAQANDMIVIGVTEYSTRAVVSVDGNAVTLQWRTNYYTVNGSNSIYTYTVPSTASVQVRMANAVGNDANYAAYLFGNASTVASKSSQYRANTASTPSLTNTLDMTSGAALIVNVVSLYGAANATAWTNHVATNALRPTLSASAESCWMALTPSNATSQVSVWTNTAAAYIYGITLSSIAIK